MIWNNSNDFFAMGGYALYVWGSVLVVLLCIAAELSGLYLRRQSIHMRLGLEANLRTKSGTDNP